MYLLFLLLKMAGYFNSFASSREIGVERNTFQHSYPIAAIQLHKIQIGQLQSDTYLKPPSIMYQIGMQRTNHTQALCYKFDYIGEG